MHDYNGAQRNQKKTGLLLFCQPKKAQQQYREQIYHIQPHDVLKIQHRIAGERIGNRQRRYFCRIQARTPLVKKNSCCKRADGNLHQYQKVHEQENIRSIHEPDKERKRAGQEEEKHAPQAHASGVGEVQQDAVLPLQDIFQIQKQRGHLLAHIAPRERFFAQRIEAADSKEQKHHQKRSRRREQIPDRAARTAAPYRPDTVHIPRSFLISILIF